ncbi:hypothetical protein M409DRAFT_29246 [Zasmidium cellare ATCC 36951]|uniref:Alkaline phosphatase n=1 Tax=Zasmidium cellare ATCC 36951 TaxID=1080233 RepID=A0A6A6C2J0_ZASCE|nr:uncharacterized protein M409DRAFT_29246 [Zasmidium cellare ATCC 36951]KAF2160400.1 hypothetical protein M409DRAFT_29246 [Zasmidium cellare ATCC 36951]
MRTEFFLLWASAQAAVAAIRPKNFIMVIPDGMAPASQTLVRTYLSMLNGGSPEAPAINAMPIDETPLGNTRTHSSNNLITDSAAAGTALACGFKTNNGALGVTPDGQALGSILEAAKQDGYLTALVVTSIINHATPAAYSSHSVSRNALPQIAEQQIGYSHPLNQSVDILLGGGRCYFKPQSDSTSCREDDIDLFAYAKDKGYSIAQNRSSFDALSSGRSRITLPYLGLFNDNDLSYEIDRQQQPQAEREPSLSEMTETALQSLDRARQCRGRHCRNRNDKGYFLMIEASRIDHSSHAHDAAAHLHDTLEYNNVMEKLINWIDAHPDTAMLSVADHETGGLTLPGYDPRLLQTPTHSIEYLSSQWDESDKSESYLRSDILPAYGLSDASDAEVQAILGDFSAGLADALSERAGISWSTGGHSGVDTTLYGYAAGRTGEQLKADMAGGFDNTEIPRYIEQALGVNIDRVTRELRAKGTGWIP